ncbi:VTT domain-containing protein [Planococcus sp. ISL-110]|uniref:TVP38/TMEM64 family protein n=1 Tax=Planococcus sp. ISL-110 TaxID=2819167 RepID=UPI001BED0EB6|nr:VTT domain-containing protein [Planococcus sp. ISL-110]MBT2570842.1 VTT domain-containing protein [Planococcus sp. ISL-110]
MFFSFRTFLDSYHKKEAALIGFIPASIEFIVLLIVNLAVGAAGFIPSVLVTAVNIQSFGLYGGAALTFIGEIFGALLGFYLYRFGFSKANPKWLRHPFWQKFQHQSPKRVFSLVILLRLLPFMPSGLVTAGAALTKISGKRFWTASTLGKIPAVLLELTAVYGFTQVFPTSVQYIVFATVLMVSIVFWQLDRLKTAKQKKTPQSAD